MHSGIEAGEYLDAYAGRGRRRRWFRLAGQSACIEAQEREIKVGMGQVSRIEADLRSEPEAKAGLEDQLREISFKLGDLEKKTASSRWLFKALSRKHIRAPRDISRRMSNSWRKRRGALLRLARPDVIFRLSRLTDRRYRKYLSSWILLQFEPLLPTRVAERMRKRMAKYASARGAATSALGHLDAVGRFPFSDGIVIAGWEIHAPHMKMSIVSDQGATFSLDQAFRFCRQDVADTLYGTLERATAESGFMLYLTNVASAKSFRLVASTSEKAQNLCEAKVATIGPDARQATEWLLGIATPLCDLHKRVHIIDEPALAPLISQARKSWDKLPIQTEQLGTAGDPRVSIIVPLLKRYDFVEHQLLEFCEDPWLRLHAELIYVIDAPDLAQDFAQHAESLHRLYKIPFSWIWGGANRGVSGASNLGANHARGEYLLFLSHDVFPQRQGWLKTIIEVLEQRSEIGAVGPRLIFPDGKIRHAGMTFLRRHDLGIWLNDHPHKGVDSSLDPHRDITIVPAVTGACMAVRRADFERVGGWDANYLLGDFEDSDFCLKLRSEGLMSAYVPSVQLVQLNQHSLEFLGHGDFRARVTIFNACRHQTRWAQLLK